MSRKKQNNRHVFLRFAFVVYMAMMLWLLFGRSRGWVDGLSYRDMLKQNINFKPLYTIRNYWQVVAHGSNQSLFVHCFINLVGNVAMFVPAGWLIPGIWRGHRNFFQFLATTLASILLIELTQLLTLLGSFDIDDVILNMSGLFLGYFAYLLTHHR